MPEGNILRKPAMFRLKKELQNIKTILFITLIWIVSVLLYFTVIFQAIEVVSPGKINFAEQYLLATLIAVLLGLMNGIFEVYVFRNLLKRLPFILVTISKTFFFLLSFFLTVVIIILINPLQMPIWEEVNGTDKFFRSFSKIFFTREMIAHIVYVVIMSFGINFFLQVNRKMGKGVLFNLFVGKYHKPVEEKRIIMFIDLTSSSSIAEILTPRLYSSFIKDFFYDIDDIVEQNKGSIFQFVGDEAVIVWKMKEGIENNNCLKMFFEIEKRIRSKSDYYKNKYNIIPEFKAGIHYGNVIVTEVGGSKQEIAYHGDATNTAARIRSVCNSYDKKLLTSAELISIMSDIDEHYTVTPTGVTSFKGKNNVLGLFSVEEKQVN